MILHGEGESCICDAKIKVPIVQVAIAVDVRFVDGDSRFQPSHAFAHASIQSPVKYFAILPLMSVGLEVTSRSKSSEDLLEA